MRLSVPDRVRSLRSLVQDARSENARMIAAAIGGHLAAITARAAPAAVAPVSSELREASFHLLTGLHRGEEPRDARERALRSVDALDAAVRPTTAPPAREPRPDRPRRTARAGFGRARVVDGAAAG